MADKYTPRLKGKYDAEIAAAMKAKFGYKNDMEIPRIEKITLNMGVGEASQDKKKVQTAAAEMELIAGQKPVITKAKKSIAQFKLREGMPIGCKVTLRRERMYEFLDRLITIAMPRIRDFRGLNPKSFDGRGNYAMGLKEQIIFPEISYDQIDKVRGLDIIVTTSAKTDDEARELLRLFGFPFPQEAGSVDHGHHVRQLGDGSTVLGGVFHLNHAVHLAQAQTDQDLLLVLGATDRRTDLLDLDLRHDRLLRDGFGSGFGFDLRSATTAEQISDLLAATLGNRLRRSLVSQRVEGGADHVVGVRGADRLGHHVVNAQAFEDGAHRTAGDDAGTGRCRTDVDLARTETALAVVVEGAAFLQRNADHLLLGRGSRLGDGLGHFACLAMTEADATLAVAHHDQSCKAEALAALHGLGDAVDVNELFDQLLTLVLVVVVAATTVVATATAATITAVTALATTATATTATFALLATGLFDGCSGIALQVGFVSHDQNSRPPSRAASASALTRPWNR